MGYSANSSVKQAMERAHTERSRALFSGVSWLFRFRKTGTSKTPGIWFSRWA